MKLVTGVMLMAQKMKMTISGQPWQSHARLDHMFFWYSARPKRIG